ncbi:hypothetical protein GGQ88_003385 [Novosphingobium hassiacum]|uniref:Uncharacterized protein n=1 Tax=Novosphingobium hassiacum TaxID=173676 RepID=A0A7W5ZYY1_9SPHN|nr:hypothetical protein [Novosphingobium hassiacum]MBB3862091.1 hypothetical protein [Novosphingobium hassiacum]
MNIDDQRVLGGIDRPAPINGEALTIEPIADQARQTGNFFNQQQQHFRY